MLQKMNNNNMNESAQIIEMNANTKRIERMLTGIKLQLVKMITIDRINHIFQVSGKYYHRRWTQLPRDIRIAKQALIKKIKKNNQKQNNISGITKAHH